MNFFEIIFLQRSTDNEELLKRKCKKSFKWSIDANNKFLTPINRSPCVLHFILPGASMYIAITVRS